MLLKQQRAPRRVKKNQEHIRDAAVLKPPAAFVFLVAERRPCYSDKATCGHRLPGCPIVGQTEAEFSAFGCPLRPDSVQDSSSSSFRENSSPNHRVQRMLVSSITILMFKV
ncbi:GL16635 [Drosophila persimilis]|uniref:GL16635 n=1 Tax=Drosophila persimilis TaxID=7234 RepID=B4IQZ4_DROPE|nr:GL16635 [Drosophila persimilis]